MRTIEVAAIFGLVLLSCPSSLLAQYSAMNGTSGQMRTSGAIRPATGATNYNYGAAYTQWARRGYQGGVPMQGMRPYWRGAAATMRQSNINGVSANSFNPANPNRQQGDFDERSAYDDYGWMDFEEVSATPQRAMPGNSAGGLPSNNTYNATNAQGYTGAVVPGADQVAAPGDVVTPNGQSMNQQPSEWRFYPSPLMDRMPTQQTPQSNVPAGSGNTPTQSQQPSGVSEAAVGGPIKY